MELLELLEQRVATLITQVNSQRAEIAKLEADNASLREEVETTMTILGEENNALKEALESERAIKDNVRGRIDMLLAQIRETADEA